MADSFQRETNRNFYDC